jgi:hypothetical protein
LQPDTRDPATPSPAPPGDPAAGAAPLGRTTLYPRVYLCFVFLAALDVIITLAILHLGGHELNALADWVIQRYDVPGVVVYKFGLVVVVVLLCEIIGRRRPRRGQLLARWAVVISAFPVVIGTLHLLNRFLQ